MQNLRSLAALEKKPLLLETAQRVTQELSPQQRDTLPTEDFIRTYQVRRGMFLNPFTQTRDTSQHNLLHATATEILASHLAHVANTAPDFLQTHQPIDVAAEAIAGSVHDTQRFFNNIESAIDITAHARRAAHSIDSLTASMGQGISEATKATAAELVMYHDDAVVPKEHNTPALQIFKLADSLGMVRFILHPSSNLLIRNLSYQTVEDKLLSYPFTDPFVADTAKKYIPVALALYSLSNDYMEIFKKSSNARTRRPRLDREYQVDAVIAAATDLGLLAK